MKGPINYFGGKFGIAPKIVRLIPDHRIYVEPFFGGGSVLFAKPASPVEVANDAWRGVVDFYKVLQDSEKFARFERLCALSPYSRALYREYVETWVDCADDVERAYRWFYVVRSSFSGNFGKSWGYTVGASAGGRAASVNRWLGAIDRLPEVSERLMRVQFDCDAATRVILRYARPDTFFYLDPPYVHSTRSSSRDYRCEMTDAEHVDLVDLVLCSEGKFAISGYANPIYARLESAGWRRIDWDVPCYAAGRTRLTGLRGAGAAAHQRRTESLWLNYDPPAKIKNPDVSAGILSTSLSN